MLGYGAARGQGRRRCGVRVSLRRSCTKWCAVHGTARCGWTRRRPGPARGKHGPCERGVAHGWPGGDRRVACFAVHCSWSWCIDRRRRSVPLAGASRRVRASGGITRTRPITRACWPGGGGGEWACRCRGRVAHLRPKTRPPPKACQHGAVAGGGEINKWACSLPHETVFCVDARAHTHPRLPPVYVSTCCPLELVHQRSHAPPTAQPPPAAATGPDSWPEPRL